MIWALHGNLGQPGDWDAVRSEMPEWEWRTPDLWTGPVIPLDRWELDVQGDPNAVLLGYSMGGRLAMHALLASPGSWKAAVFVSAHPGLETEVERTKRLRVDAVWAALLRSGATNEFLDAWNRQPALAGEPSAATQDRLLQERRDVLAAAFECWSLGTQENLRSALATCAVPQLWIAGAEDQKFTGIMREAAARIPSAAYAEIEGSGHRVPLRNPTRLAECVRRFLAVHRLNP